MMAGILATILLSITFLSTHIQAVPSEAETVISQLARTVYNGRGLLYLLTISSTTIILIMAATWPLLTSTPGSVTSQRCNSRLKVNCQGQPAGVFQGDHGAGNIRVVIGNRFQAA